MKKETVKILLIDDDTTDRQLFVEAVKSTRIPSIVIEASSGEKAIEILKKCDADFPHCIFLDLNMPIMDGRETLKLIKSSDQLKSVPVFIMSTTASPNDVSTSYKTGVNLFLEKPADFNDFVELLECILTIFHKSVVLPKNC
ncbi:MAG TPA: response regulator [Bacteroidia bacterium]|jgi:two-component system response regulator